MRLATIKVLVTGGAVRIGKVISEAFASTGAAVRIHCNTSVSEAEELRDSLPEPLQSKHEFVQCNFTFADLEDLRAIIKDCNVLVNNASIYLPADKTLKADVKQNQYKVNYEIPVMLMDLFATENKFGCVINLLDASVMDANYQDSDSYSRSKYDLKLMTIKKAISLAPDIRVNGVAPGAIIPPEWLAESEMEKSISAMLLKKAPTMKNIADACVFLAANDGITGEIIHVDGGSHLTK